MQMLSVSIKFWPGFESCNHQDDQRVAHIYGGVFFHGATYGYWESWKLGHLLLVLTYEWLPIYVKLLLLTFVICHKIRLSEPRICSKSEEKVDGHHSPSPFNSLC